MSLLWVFGMARVLRIIWLEPNYPNLTRVEDVNMWKKTCLVCDSISTTTMFTTEAWQDTFKIQKGSWIVTLKKCYTYWNAKSLVESTTLGKRKPNFATGLIITKVNIEHLEKVIKKFIRNFFTLSIISMATVEFMIGVLWFLDNVKHMSS